MKRLFLIVLLGYASTTFAQGDNRTNIADYPTDYFRNPLDIPIFLAGNFGECRPGHFHSGVDIKTQGKENQPVHAAADGYISRIKMDKGGFGHALYITHPNGFTTLYAHLNDFSPAIQKYLKKEQYEKKHWDVDVQLTPTQFPVKKGQQIAWSGNTGASTAPHLHFEIRNTATEHPLNPEMFGLPIVDKTAPVVAEVAFYNTAIPNGEPITFPLAKREISYVPAHVDRRDYEVKNDTVNVPPGTVGIGVNLDDYMDGSENTIAFYTAKLYVDDSLQTQVTLDDIGYDETRYVNAYTDYRAKQQHNKWIQRLYQLPGNHLDHIYSYLNSSRGTFKLQGDETHKITIVIADDNANVSKVIFYAHTPGTLKWNSETEAKSGYTRFYANRQNIFMDTNVVFTLDNTQLYDDTWFRCERTRDPTVYSNKFRIGQPWVPVHHYFDLHIKPNKQVPPELRTKVAMMYSDDKDEDGRAAARTDSGWYKARVRNFGTYWLDIDTTAPTIKSMQKNNAIMSKAKQITFDVKDDMTSVKSFSGYLDGKWICFEQHNNLFFYKFDEHCPKGRHELVFKADDENGNERIFKLHFTR